MGLYGQGKMEKWSYHTLAKAEGGDMGTWPHCARGKDAVLTIEIVIENDSEFKWIMVPFKDANRVAFKTLVT